jgi:hypothetical protein
MFSMNSTVFIVSCVASLMAVGIVALRFSRSHYEMNPPTGGSHGQSHYRAPVCESCSDPAAAVFLSSTHALLKTEIRSTPSF